MIYLDTSALLKFVKREKETDPLREWRGALSNSTDLVTSELAKLESRAACCATEPIPNECHIW